MDVSKVKRAQGHTHAGAVIEHRRFAGARVSRIMHPPGQSIAAHDHDWPVLTLYRLGGYREIGEAGETLFDGPSVVFQPAGAAHADQIGAHGLETLAMTFDPAWLKGVNAEAPCARAGGALAAQSRRMAELWLARDAAEDDVRTRTAEFLRMVFDAPAPVRPAWADIVDTALETNLSTAAAAAAAQRHPAWLARAYRAWRGEGIAEARRRRQVERATLMLRRGAEPLAEIAAACEFCDQSHMNRAFKAVLGRTPLVVREEAALLAPFAA